MGAVTRRLDVGEKRVEKRTVLAVNRDAVVRELVAMLPPSFVRLAPAAEKVVRESAVKAPVTVR